MINDRTTTPPPGRWLAFEFEVEDTGPGIPEDIHAKIFEPFVQGDLGLSKKYGGTGLGLSICSQLAGLMKGTIGLKSEVGHGSVFTISIPLKHLSSRADSTASSQVDPNSRRNSSVDESRVVSRDDARSVRSGHSVKSGERPVPVVNANAAAAGTTAGPVSFEQDSKPRLVGLSQPFFASNAPLESPNSQAAAMQRVEAEATKGGKKIKVLVAEDNTTNQIVVMRMLKLEDVYDVTVAKDGQEALDRVKESMEAGDPYNLIFMDVQMPNMDGLDSTRLIRQSGFSAPIVALTAYAEEVSSHTNFVSPIDTNDALVQCQAMHGVWHGLLPLEAHPSTRPEARPQDLLSSHCRRRRRWAEHSAQRLAKPCSGSCPDQHVRRCCTTESALLDESRCERTHRFARNIARH